MGKIKKKTLFFFRTENLRILLVTFFFNSENDLLNVNIVRGLIGPVTCKSI